MAIRRKYSIKEIQNLTTQQLIDMSEAEFNQVFVQVQDVTRKRVAKLHRLGFEDLPAEQELKASGGVKISKQRANFRTSKTETSKRRLAQIDELKRGINFIRSETSTPTGARTYSDEIIRRLNEGGYDTEGLDGGSVVRVVRLAYEAYSKAKERAPAYMKYIKYREVYKLCAEGAIVDADDFANWVADYELELMGGVLELDDYRMGADYDVDERSAYLD